MGKFAERFGSEEQCASALEKLSWPMGFRCTECGGSQSFRLFVTAGSIRISS